MKKAKLSTRAQCASDSPLTAAIGDIAGDQYHPVANPQGYVNLALAENTLMHDDLAAHLKKYFEPDSHAFSYGEGPGGSLSLKRVLSKFINRHFSPFQPIEPEDLSIAAGVTTALERCAFEIADHGDMFLLGRPYYGCYLSDLADRAGITTVPVTFGSVDPLGVEAVACYEHTLRHAQATSDGCSKVRALLLCSPHNPLGQCYPRRTLEALMRFCQKESIHLIVDEVYALSTYESPETLSATKFTSVLAIDTQDIIDQSLVHVLWGPSKDFGANSLRIGCVISPGNQTLIHGLNTHTSSSYPSTMMEHLACCILEHEDFIDTFIAESRRKLGENHALVSGVLNAYGVSLHPDTAAGFFVLANLGEALLRRCDTKYSKQQPIENGSMTNGTDDRIIHIGAEGHKDDEPEDCGILKDLTEIASQFPWTDSEIMASLDAHKVLVTAGSALGIESEGWFRIVFSHDRRIILEGLRRIVTALSLQPCGGSGDAISEFTLYQQRYHANSSALSAMGCNCGFCGIAIA